MARTIALARTIGARSADLDFQFEVLRAGVVITCATILIAAGQILPRLF